ncbi:MAG: alpha/beta hydrolase [Kofleriaceae bacterium]
MKDRLLRAAARVALRPPLGSVFARRRRADIERGLDPELAALLGIQRLLRDPPLETMEPAAARAYVENGFEPLEVPYVEMASVTDTAVDGTAGPIPVRVFVPHSARAHRIVYFHGGGGVLGSIRGSEPITRLLAQQTGCTVASVGYRLGPEHKNPAAIHDAVSAWTALAQDAPSTARIAVAGDSFGGFLAAHVDHTAARPPDLQVLIYPMVDLTMSSPSIDRHADGFLLTRSMMLWFRNHYLHATDDQRAFSPAFWPALDRAAPAIVATAGFDPLVDEGDHHAARLAAAGVGVRHRRYASLIHGFISLGGVSTAARAAIDELCQDIVELLPSR